MCTRGDLMRALTWRTSHGFSAIGAPRYSWMGFSFGKRKVVVTKTAEALLKTKAEVESAVASMIAAQPVAARLL